MDIFPDWLGQTGGAGVPYPVLVQGLDLLVAVEMLELRVDDLDVTLDLMMDVPTLSIEIDEDLSLTVETDALDLEVDGG